MKENKSKDDQHRASGTKEDFMGCKWIEIWILLEIEFMSIGSNNLLSTCVAVTVVSRDYLILITLR
jgi:hypothetical protein